MGIVESCTSREKEDQADAIKIGLDDFQNKGLDFAYAKKKGLSNEVRMNKLTPYNKEYDYLFADKIPRTHENLNAIKKENDLFQYSKTVQLRVLSILDLLSKEDLKIIDAATNFYTFTSIRKFLACNKYHVEEAYIQILKDIKFKNDKLGEYRLNLKKTLASKKFFLCGIDDNNAPIIGIRPNKKETPDISDADYESFYIYLIEDLLPSLLAKRPKLYNKFMVIIDFEGEKANPAILKSLYQISYQHYFNVVYRIAVVNLNLEILDASFVQAVKDCPDKDLITIYDKEYKRNLIKVTKPESLIALYGGNRKFSQNYLLSNAEKIWQKDIFVERQYCI